MKILLDEKPVTTDKSSRDTFPIGSISGGRSVNKDYATSPHQDSSGWGLFWGLVA